MKTYTVTLQVEGTWEGEIEAETLEEAQEKAGQMIGQHLYDDVEGYATEVLEVVEETEDSL